ncbi:MAG TPA: ACR family protein, partial [Solibacterales bacterium]|nr:ACR family protein [Bryobacterales bacterium]
SGGNDCPSFGGHKPAQYVLELNGGEARKHGLRVGSSLNFNL